MGLMTGSEGLAASSRRSDGAVVAQALDGASHAAGLTETGAADCVAAVIAPASSPAAWR
jgi:hypothetical protein